MTELKPTLVPLTSIRFLAALHILLFHVAEIERVPLETGQTPLISFFRELPTALMTLLHRGYCSTSLFFLLSGVVLTYLYLDGDGNLTRTRREFWQARLVRIYPFHIAVVALMAILLLPLVTIGWFLNPEAVNMTPLGTAPTFFGLPIPMPLYMAIGFTLNVLLVQAWFPEYALSGNFATWALSTVVFFYIAFPFVAPRLARMGRAAQWTLLACLPLVSLIPTLIYMSVAEPAPGLTIASEFLFRCPLLWLPHFMMGILVTRVARLSRHGGESVEPSRVPSWGDLAAIAALVLMSLPDAWWKEWLGMTTWTPHFLLRHGLLAPLFIVMTYDLARGRGIVAWCLSAHWLKLLGATSFSIFILQPLFMLMAFGVALIPLPALIRLVVIIATTAFLSLLADRYLDQPLANWARRKWLGK